MAHPKLATAVQRSLLTATTAALMVGPLAGAGLAQDSVVDPVLDLTCEEAKKTEKPELIEEFCPEDEATESPLDKSVDEVTGTVEKTAGDAGETVAPDDEAGGENGGGGGGGGGGTDPTGVLSPTKGQNPTNSKVGATGDGFRGVDEGGAAKGQRGPGERGTGAPGDYGYNTNGLVLPGMRSNSSLTLQPFAAPLVSVPPVYELPQIASQLFGGDSAATAEGPVVAGAATATDASAYSSTGFSATADPTGWLAATATGLIMLVGAGHAINGGRTPKRRRA